MSLKTFYKMRLIPSEGGLEVHTQVWESVKETECFYFCVAGYWLDLIKRTSESYDISMYEAWRKYYNHIKLKRIAKGSTRFAQESREEALEKLKWLKRRQLMYLKRDIELINQFLDCDQLEDYGPDCQRVPGSVKSVLQYFRFDS